MKTTPFFSKEIKVGRIFKALGVSLLCLVSITTVFTFGYDSLLTLYSKYSAASYVKNSEVLGVEDMAEFTGSYGDYKYDEAVWDFEMDREGYYKLDELITYPEFYLPVNKGAVKETWLLKGQRKLNLSCPDLSKELVVAGNSYGCTLTYNNQVLNKNVRMIGTCDDVDKQTGCSLEVAFRVYSNRWGSSNANEYIVTYEWATGSKDEISVYKLSDGKSTHLKFNEDGRVEDKWFISSYASELYGKYTTWENKVDFNDEVELVTLLHEPSMGSGNNLENIFKIWKVKDSQLIRIKTVFDLYRDDEGRYWN
ncbi:MAG TPA: hypothetical protein PLV59_01990 [Candidatus Dojkabacteria bacterium]|nr:hypothetical protein [Candidatus Dojkabacteria bacterium]